MYSFHLYIAFGLRWFFLFFFFNKSNDGHKSFHNLELEKLAELLGGFLDR